MAEATVREWIADYKSLRSSEIHSFANIILQNNDLIQALFTILEEKRYHQDLLEPVCEQLFSLYRSREAGLQRFTRQYIPTLIGLYLSNVAKGCRKDIRCVEVLLLGIYNLEVIDSNGKPTNISFRIPSISKPSIYHEPMSLSHSALTERALSSLDYADCRKFTMGPHGEVEKIDASNRLHVMTVLMCLYNQHISLMSSHSHVSLSKMCSRIVKQGYNRCNRSNYSNDCTSSYGNPHPRPIARIPLSPPFILELVHGIYFAMFNGLATVGIQTLEEIHNRAMHEMSSDVLLVTNAIRNSLKYNPSGQPNDGPMGISVALSPTTVASTVSRAITNASFRTKKLPDDIPILDGSQAHENHLASINEEETPETTPEQAVSNVRGKKQSSSNSYASAITKVAVLQLRKNKDKKKEKESTVIETNDNGKSVSLSTSNSSHSDVALNENGEEMQAGSFTNGEQVPFRKGYSYKTELLSKCSLGNNSPTEGNRNSVDNFLDESICSNHVDSDGVMKSEVSFILKPGMCKSESVNGIQSSSMQTAV